MIISRFEEQVKKHADKCAVKAGHRELTYRQLQNLAYAAAAKIHETYLRTGSQIPRGLRTVALLFEHGIDMIAGVLAALAAEKIYIPFDPSYPEKRLAHMLEDAGARLLVTNTANMDLAEHLAAHAAHPVEILNIGTVEPAENAAACLAAITAGQEPIPDPDAYILYTSGSTGKPKGVLQSQRAILHFTDSYNRDLELTAEDRLTLFSAFSHDAAVMDIYASLLNGATLYPLNIKQQDITGIAGWLLEEGITVYHSVPTLYRYFINSLSGGESFPRLRYFVLGGEAVLPEDVRRFRQVFGGTPTAMFNLYGQSESSYNAGQLFRPDQPFEKIVLGTPTAETELLVIDDEGEEVKPFQVGEIVVASPYVARGYWKDPEKTEALFDEDEELGRLYFTGDQGKLLLDGTIEFVGRTDFQVKIRGYRVEPGEIETALLQHEFLKEAVVTANDDPGGGKMLCAYVVPQPGREITPADLREYLSGEVMDHMVPAYFVLLETMPRTPTGKLDRKALPEIDVQQLSGTEYAPPGDKLESQLVDIWQEVLNLDRVGIDDDFFQVGGHSLKATVMAARVHKHLKVEFPLREIFRTPTIRAMARHIRGAGQSIYASIEPLDKQPYYPLSAQQQRLFALNRLESQGSGTGYNMPGAVTIEGPLDLEQLETAFQKLIQRHEALRTSFHLIDGEPRQKVHETVEFGLEQRGEGRGVFERGEKDEAPLGALLSSFIRPFDLSKAPLFRAAVFSLPSPLSPLPSLFFDMHHIISDGTSRGIILADLLRLYSGEEPAPLRVQYKDYAAWQRQLFTQGTIAAQETFWKEVFHGDIPLLSLPLDAPRPAIQSFEGATHEFRMPGPLVKSLKDMAAGADATIYMVLLTLFNVLLARYSGQQDIVVGTVTAGRPHADLQDIAGMFVNTLALRNYPADTKSFSHFLAETRERTLKAFDNQDYPFDRLVEQLDLRRDLSRNPIFDTVFVLQNIERTQLEMKGLRFIPVELEETTAKFDISLTAAELDGELGFALEYSTLLIRAETMQGFSRHFLALAAAAAHDPGMPIGDLEFISGEEKLQLLETFNDTETALPGARTFYHMFLETVERSPHRTAAVDGESCLTYGELKDRARATARMLKEQGAAGGTITALWAEPGMETIIALLAILDAGSAFLPIDPRYPPERIRFLLSDSNARVLITDNPSSARELIAAGRDRFVTCPTPQGARNEPILFDVESIASDWDSLQSCPYDSESAPGDVAYVIYTSGSTGRPKGVMVENRSLVNLCLWHNSVYEVTHFDRASRYAGIGFDASVWEMFPYFAAGASVCIVPDEVKLDSARLSAFFNRYAVTAAFLPTRMCEQFMQMEEEPASLRLLVTGGDKLRDFRPRGFRIYNNYGPTENTVVTTYFEVTQTCRNIPIGRPVFNSRVYILSRRMKLQPPGVAGELCVSGLGVARGYLNRPELTSDRFIGQDAVFNRSYPNGAGLYKTGDLARWLPDGNLEFLGRIDFQVKIRGFRIELGEIEAQLTAFDGVGDAVAAALQDEAGHYYLCAYLVEENKFDIHNLREYLLTKLPDYMVPAHFVMIESLPLDAHGKVNRKALPEPEGATVSGEAYEAPRDPMEEKLTALWREILQVEPDTLIGVHHNFFHIGGHSLKATVLSARIHQSFDVEVPLPELFKSPTIRQLAHYIKSSRPSLFTAIKPVETAEYYPLSASQQRLYTLENFDGGNRGTVYNIPMAMTIEGPLDRERMEKAFQKLIQRHEALRTSFHLIDGEPRQKVHETVNFVLEERGEKEEAPAGASLSRFIRPFDLSKAPLFRAAVLSLPSPFSPLPTLFIDLHHLISDGTSMGILVREFVRLYSGEAPAPLEIQYKDYAHWQRNLFQSDAGRHQAAFWKEQFSGHIPLLDLPLDDPRPPIRSFEGAAYTSLLDMETVARLKSLASQNQVTLYMLLLALYNIFLARYSGQEDIVTGTSTAGRSHAGLQDIIGMFVNTLALRNYPGKGKKVAQFLQEVKQRSLDAFDNQDFQFEELVESLNPRRDLSRNPLFDTMFSFQNFDTPVIQLEELRFTVLDFQNPVAKFDLVLNAWEEDREIACHWQYGTKIFRPATIVRMARHFSNAAESISFNPSMRLQEVQFIGEDEKHRLLVDFNETQEPYPTNTTLPRLFEEQVEAAPGNIALVFGENRVSYAQYNRACNRLARLLREKGAGPGQIVAVMTEQPVETVIALMAVMKAGAAYLPIPPDIPAERKRYILADSVPHILLTDNPSHAQELITDCTDSFVSCPNPQDAGQETILFDVGSIASDWDRLQTCPYTEDSAPGDVAYIIYTSGSTGRPKGVMVEHRQVVNTLVCRREMYRLDSNAVALQLFSYAFDGFVTSFFTPVISGASVVLLPPGTAGDIEAVVNAIGRAKVTHFISVPPLYGALLAHITPGDAVTLRVVTLAGDTLPPKVIEKTRAKIPHLELVNEYGLTEAAVMSTIHRNQEKGLPVSIGRPTWNTEIYMTQPGNHHRLTPLGVSGEICIAGAGVSRGYLNNPELTHQRFVHNPYMHTRQSLVFPPLAPHSSRLYKSGDLGRFSDEGHILFGGRADFQVKVRGFRIEPGEIENRLLSFTAVREAVVIHRTREDGDAYLCAYMTSNPQVEEAPPSSADLIPFLSLTLPDYMVPQYFTWLPELPLSSNGKVDRKSLPEPEAAGGEMGGYEPPGNQLEERLELLWRELLNLERVGVQDNFFHIGGHSLKATMLAAQVHREFQVQLSLPAIFQAPTVRGMAQLIRKARKAAYSAVQPLETREYYPLSSAQKRLFALAGFETAGAGTSYNMPAILRVKGPLDLSWLETVFRELVHRHESLRTSFTVIGGEPVQRVHRAEALDFQVHSLEAPDSPPRLRQIIEDFIRPFDLSRAPLLRVQCVETAPRHCLLMIDMHHIVTDGASMGVLVREFTRLYDGNRLAPPVLQYRDYAAWRHAHFRSAGGEQQETFWKEQFSGDIPVPDLPLDFPRPAIQRFDGHGLHAETGLETANRVNALASAHGATPFMVLLAVFNVFLSRWSGRQDIVVGTPTAGRPHADLETIIGMFVNTLALRNFPAADKTFSQFMNETVAGTLEAFENQDFQFEELLELLDLRRDMSRNPLFDTMFTMQNFDIPDMEIRDLEFSAYEQKNSVAKFDLMVTAYETPTGMAFDWQYGTHLFKEETIRRMTGHYIHLVNFLCSDPAVKLRDAELLGEDERRQLLVDFNDTGTQYPSLPLSQLFVQQAEAAPHRAAVIGTVTLTYGELDRRAGILAALLQEKGVRRNTLVGLMTERSVEMVIAVLGILKAGGAYLPIDPNYPTGRIQYMIDDSNLQIILTDNLSHAQERITARTDRFVTCPNPRDAREEFILVDVGSIVSDWDSLQSCPYDSESVPGDIAYVMYTSGTTGKPKAVVVEHRNVVRLVKNTNYIEFSPEDRILQTGNIVFDATTFELWGMLLNGGGLVLEAGDIILDAFLLGEALKRHRVTILWLTALLFNQLIDQDARIFSGLKYLLAGGDVLSPPHVNKVRAACPGLTVINGYGPTENTTFSTCHRIAQGYGRNIPIGAPIANSTAYILDRYGAPVPIGVVGELWLGGDGVARGYLNSPDLTADRFIQQDAVFNSSYSNGALLYKSGDLARWLPEGVIEFIGRIDHQVKIRGFRIETGEIETQLLAHGAVNDAVVIPRDDGDGNKVLCAYLAVETEIDTAGLREFLLKELPDYMLPAYYVQMDRFPLNPNGKVDRKALPEPDITVPSGAEYVPPKDDVESRLADIWSRLLKRGNIGVHDNFFDIGGHSLKATQITARVHREFDIRLPLQEIFRTPTIRGLADYIKNAAGGGYASIKPVEYAEYYPLSSAQKRLFTLDNLEGKAAIAYNMPFAMTVEGPLDNKKLETAFQRLIQRHESLRTSFHLIGGEPRQRVHETVNFSIETLPPSPHSFIRPFDLSHAPLLRVGISSSPPSLFIDMHHIVSDGTSVGILVREFGRLYQGEELPPLEIQYKDYASWQRHRLLEGRQKDLEVFWKEQFSGGIPVLEMPTDAPRPAMQQFEGAVLHIEPGVEWSRQLDKLTHSYGATRFMTLLAIYNVLLSFYTGQQDIITGTPTAGRPHADLEPIIGMFVNTLALRNFPAPEKGFGDFLTEVKQRFLQCYENQDYQFESLLETLELRRDLSRNPLFDTMFSLQNLDIPSLDVGEGEERLRFTSFEQENTVSKFDLMLMGFEMEDALGFDCQYSVHLFKKETVERFLSHFINLGRAVAENPDILLSEIDILSQQEKQRLLVDFNDTRRPYPSEKSIPQLFSDQAVRTPDRVALVGSPVGGNSASAVVPPVTLTYRELDDITNRLALMLVEQGVEAESIVAIMVERSLEMVMSLLAILKAGGAYLPIDPEYPPDRIVYMLSDSHTRLIMTDNPSHAQELITARTDRFVTCPTPQGAREECILFDVGSVVSDWDRLQTCPYERESAPGGLAYVLYTSGTTGRPKAVMVEHYSVGRLVKNTNFIEFREDDRVLLTSNVVFDVTTFELWGALLNGLQLILVSRDVVLDTGPLGEALVKNRVTILWLTSQLFNQLVDREAFIFRSLRCLMAGGDVLSPPHINWVREACPRVEVINGYGPTENTAFSTCFSIREDYERNIPIGGPIANSTCYIIDRNHRLTPVGVAGELLVGGDGVARGYLNRPELTSDRFIGQDVVFNRSYRSYRSYPNDARLYKTGDLARWLPDGTIDFLGRIDHQVKIRGFRIETGEIETRLLAHEAVMDAVVLARGERDGGGKYLCAYIVPDTAVPVELTPAILREHLLAALPDYMVPSFFIIMEQLPLNPSGKVDRKALPEPEGSQQMGAKYEAPADAVETRLAELWQEVLTLEKIGVHDNFFEIGGHSLKATVLAAAIHKEFGVQPALRDMFRFPTVRTLAGFIKDGRTSLYTSIEPAEPAEYYPLSFAQKRLFMLNRFEAPGAATSYNMPMPLTIKGTLDIQKLETAFSKLIQRHESLRTSFHLIDGQPKQKVHETVAFNIETLPSPPDAFIRPFDLSKAPLLRVGFSSSLPSPLSPLPSLFLDMHHIISDGTSLGILIQEFGHLYSGEELPPPRLQYKDFACWQHREEGRGLIRAQKEFWKATFEDEIPVLDLPLDFPRPAVRGFEGAMVRLEAGPETLRALKKTVSQTNTTLFTIMLAAYNVLLAKYASCQDTVVGSVIAGRAHADLQEIIGMFVNTLPLRNFPVGKLGFRDFLGDVRDRTFKAFENQDYPFEELVEVLDIPRDMARNPLFDTVFILQNIDMPKTRVGELTFTPQRQDSTVAKFDISITAGEGENNLAVLFEYGTALFRRETIQRMGRHYLHLLDRVAAEPSLCINDLDLLGPEEREQVLVTFNDTANPYPAESTVMELFAQQAGKTPDRTALTGPGGECITYKELNFRSSLLAAFLCQKGVKPDGIVGIMSQRSLHLISAILGILKAGGAYLPLDPNYPAGRIRYMLADSNAHILLTDNPSAARELIPGCTDRGSYVTCPNSGGTGQETILFDVGSIASTRDKLQTPPCPDDSESAPGNLAYVIYTSGTTGKPKGVAVQHGNVVTYVHAFLKNYDVTSGDVLLQQASYSFDAFVDQLFPLLVCGGRLVVSGDDEVKDIRRIARNLVRHHVTLFGCAPLFLNELDKLDIEFPALRLIISAGDVLKPGYMARLAGKTAIYNAYGPTETTVGATHYRCGPNEKPDIPIGRPNPNYRLYILGRGFQPQPVGIPGEMYISGPSVARGYLNHPELISERFIEQDAVFNRSYRSYPGGVRIYRTGDFARWLPDGSVQFLGRIDNQVSLRGFRVELGEIETRLLSHPQVVETTVIAGTNNDGTPYLCAYFSAPREVTGPELMEHLAGELPDYMIPAFFIQLEKLPLTANGKIDKKALPDPRGHMLKETEFVPPRSDTEAMLAAIWQELLQLERIGVHDNFFHIGGDSLKAIRLLSQLQLNFEVTLNDVFHYQTIARLAENLHYKKDSMRELIMERVRRAAVPSGDTGVDEKELKLAPQWKEYRRKMEPYRTMDLSRRKSYEHILLTGATGFLGIHLLCDLLRTGPARIYVLVRGDSEEAARQRLREKIRYYFRNSFPTAEMEKRVDIIRGDLAGEDFGLPPDLYRTLADRIDCIINSAAYVKHFGHYDDFHRMNVAGVERLVTFAGTGRPKDLHHVSTTTVGSGAVEGLDYALYTEDHHDIGQHNENLYIASKQEAEKRILQAREKGIISNIYRVGNLVFHSATGRFQENIEENAFYLMVRAFVKIGMLPGIEEKNMDFCFIDTASEAMLRLFDRANLLNHTHHIHNSNYASLTDFAGMMSRAGFPIRALPMDKLLEQLLELHGDPALRSQVETILLHTHMLETPKAGGTEMVLPADRTDLLLERLDFHWPALNNGHVKKMLEHCKDVKFL